MQEELTDASPVSDVPCAYPHADLSLGSFEKLPDITGWLPADLVLFRCEQTYVSWLDKAIIKAQANRYEGDDARWFHAGMYAGHGQIIQATYSVKRGGARGVLKTPLVKFFPGSIIRVRRDTLLTDEQRLHVVATASEWLGDRYSLTLAWTIRVQLARWDWESAERNRLRRKKALSAAVRRVVCSTLYGDAYSIVTARQVVTDRRGGVVIPADLSRSSRFTDLKLRWCRVASEQTPLTISARPGGR